jgi:hypothetical protein
MSDCISGPRRLSKLQMRSMWSSLSTIRKTQSPKATVSSLSLLAEEKEQGGGWLGPGDPRKQAGWKHRRSPDPSPKTVFGYTSSRHCT